MKYFVIVVLALVLQGCASKVIMKNCEKAGNDFWMCEEP